MIGIKYKTYSAHAYWKSNKFKLFPLQNLLVKGKKALMEFYGQSKNKETDVNNFIVNLTENKGKNSVCKDSEPGYLRGKT